MPLKVHRTTPRAPVKHAPPPDSGAHPPRDLWDVANLEYTILAPGFYVQRSVMVKVRTGLCLAAVCVCAAGCGSRAASGVPDRVWGRRGRTEGRLLKPRAAAIDANDRLYLVDMTARIQVFDREGNYLHGWSTPTCEVGKPAGLTVDRLGRLLVADTHYFRVLVYSLDGKLLTTLGGTYGKGPGEFGFTTDAVTDSKGHIYVSEYGLNDRVQKFSPQGKFLLQFGGHGQQPGRFVRPQGLAVDRDDRVYVADACNHRVQVFSAEGRLVRTIGRVGTGPGELSYPYDLAFNSAGELYVCEYGNHRVQKFDRQFRPAGTWGRAGRRKGEFWNPWALVIDSQDRVHVIDTNNHRVQRIHL